MESRFSRTLRKTAVAAAAGILVLGTLTFREPVYALGGFNLKSEVITYPINEYMLDIAPGVSETRYSFIDSEGKRVEAFVVHVDLSNPLVSVEAGTPYGGNNFGMQTVKEQAEAVSRKGHRVVAAVNGDYYNMANGVPLGIVYKNGRMIKGVQDAGWKFFAITKDGEAIIGDEKTYEKVKGNIKEALGGHNILVKDGQVFEAAKINAGRNPRTGVGIKDDGSIFFVIIDGRQEPYSGGITSADFAELMVDLGAETALDLDGGGSTTYVSRRPGMEGLSVTNSPSGGERRVANSWLIVSKAKSSNVFRWAAIEPYHKSYTPGSIVQFKAKGLDKSLAPASMPRTKLEWILSDQSFGEIDEDGKFVSNGKTGQVQVSLNRLNKLRGSTWIEIQDPDEMYFETSQITVRENSTKALSLTLMYEKRKLIWNPQDIEWEVPSSLGTVDEKGVLHVKKDAKPGKVTARYKNSELSAQLDVAIAPSPKIMFDFEGNAKDWKTSTVGKGVSSSIKLGSLPQENSSLGKKALKINFDFTKGQKQSTLGVYGGPGSKVRIPGNPSSIGIWVYAPPQAKGYWLRMGITDAGGNLSNINITSWEGVNWTGWKYIEVKIPAGLKGPLYLHPTQAIRIMSAGSGVTGPMTKGYIYVDNISAVYGG